MHPGSISHEVDQLPAIGISGRVASAGHAVRGAHFKRTGGACGLDNGIFAGLMFDLGAVSWADGWAGRAPASDLGLHRVVLVTVTFPV